MYMLKRKKSWQEIELQYDDFCQDDSLTAEDVDEFYEHLMIQE